MSRQRQDGFTITELVISITVAGVLIFILFSATFYYYVNAMQAQTATDLALESQSILAQLTEDIRLSDAISSTNAISDPNSPLGGWTTSDPSNIIMANAAASGNTAQTTCPQNLASPTCPPDRLFSSNASNLSFTFYDSSDNTTSNATQARSVNLQVDMAKKVFGKNIVLSNTTRVTLRNL
jgi:prepilin-type N-terminal cleavage/methylation domain-containing protein